MRKFFVDPQNGKEPIQRRSLGQALKLHDKIPGSVVRFGGLSEAR